MGFSVAQIEYETIYISWIPFLPLQGYLTVLVVFTSGPQELFKCQCQPCRGNVPRHKPEVSWLLVLPSSPSAAQLAFRT